MIGEQKKHTVNFTTISLGTSSRIQLLDDTIYYNSDAMLTKVKEAFRQTSPNVHIVRNHYTIHNNRDTVFFKEE
jgi:hypothetical protein